jgi:hypothetical protein
MSLSCEVLKLLDIEWQIIPKDLKMKCRSRIDENSVSEYEQSLLMEGGEDSNSLLNSNKDEMIKEFLRKNFVKFYINIYKENHPPTIVGGKPPHSGASPGGSVATPHSTGGMSSAEDLAASGTRYMLDIHLFKGTVYVFMDFVRKFMHVLTASCSMCSSNSAQGSSAQGSNVDLQSCYSQHHHHDYKLKMVI